MSPNLINSALLACLELIVTCRFFGVSPANCRSDPAAWWPCSPEVVGSIPKSRCCIPFGAECRNIFALIVLRNGSPGALKFTRFCLQLLGVRINCDIFFEMSLLLLLLLPFWYVQAFCEVVSTFSTLSHCVHVCVFVHWFSRCWKQENMSRSCVRLLACCKYRAIPLSRWECSLVKKEFFSVKVVKRKKLTKNLYLKKRMAEEGGLLLFFHVNIECYIVHVIYIIYMPCMRRHLSGIFSYSF